MDNKVIANRLKDLRYSLKLSQAKVANLYGTTQASINRYEHGQSDPPFEILLWYADFFDVSLDYIFGRTDKPQGKIYQNQPKVVFEDENMKNLIEMCFDPKSPANAKLKEALYSLLSQKENWRG